MTLTTALLIAGLILALIHELQSDGKSLLGWAVVLIALALTAGRLA